MSKKVLIDLEDPRFEAFVLKAVREAIRDLAWIDPLSDHLIDLYLQGQLDEQDHRRMTKHLRRCADLRSRARFRASVLGVEAPEFVTVMGVPLR